MANILTVGIAVLDLILDTPHYPAEDEELRALSRRETVGGNAANTAQVLARLGHRVEVAAVLAPDDAGTRVRSQLEAAGVGSAQLVWADSGGTPISCIVASRESGSRTIVHHRDLRELRYDDFEAILVEVYDWVHFEGRNVPETRRMLERLTALRYKGTISLEVEKPRDGIDDIIPLADVVMFSRVFAESRDLKSGDRLLQAIRPMAPHAVMACSWGEVGGCIVKEGELYTSPAFPPERVVDSVGAGDAFNAGLIHALLAGREAADALEFACRLAGHKVGQQGFAQLDDKPMLGS
jgi:ketohexokinase